MHFHGKILAISRAIQPTGPPLLLPFRVFARGLLCRVPYRRRMLSGNVTAARPCVISTLCFEPWSSIPLPSVRTFNRRQTFSLWSFRHRLSALRFSRSSPISQPPFSFSPAVPVHQPVHQLIRRWLNGGIGSFGSADWMARRTRMNESMRNFRMNRGPAHRG